MVHCRHSHSSVLHTVTFAACCFAAFFAPDAQCYAEAFTAKVLAVSDGDTITVLHGGAKEVVRLNGIDCPEKTQAFGRKAKKFTSDKAMNKTVTVDAKKVDRDGRTIGDIILDDGTSLNRELLQEGLAWWFFKHSDDQTLKALEWAARDEKRGLWRDPIPIPPWVFRKMQHKQVPDISDFQYPGTVMSAAVLGNKQSKLYRHPGCIKFHAMLKQRNVIPLDTIESALEEGYHPASDCPRG
jgi:micrococcal nuclease